MTDLVTYALDRGVATIRMDDGKANALSIPMLAELHAAFGQAEADGAIVVLTGREGRFSGGFHLPTIRGGGPGAGDDAPLGVRSRGADPDVPEAGGDRVPGPRRRAGGDPPAVCRRADRCRRPVQDLA